ncbi:hypothetical protein CFC21_081301 [Triticum aestivum]|uniref:Uncharacterized protein n=3 Tax=Triticinae TaxID=1648030 RepID=A0A9R1I462_WHEAT|nr:hypothetical protein CFC21_081301 [Triticum aestivum]
MGVVKEMTPVALCVLGVMFLVGMADMSGLPGCGRPTRMDLQELAAQVRTTLVGTASSAAGILIWVGKVADDLSAAGWDWEMRAMFIVGVNLSLASSFLALSALVLELSCDPVVNYCIAAGLIGVHLVAAWAVRGRLRALRLRRAT